MLRGPPLRLLRGAAAATAATGARDARLLAATGAQPQWPTTLAAAEQPSCSGPVAPAALWQQHGQASYSHAAHHQHHGSPPHQPWSVSPHQLQLLPQQHPWRSAGLSSSCRSIATSAAPATAPECRAAAQQPASSASTSSSSATQADEEAAAAVSKAAQQSQISRMDFSMAQLGFVVNPYKGPPQPLGLTWFASKEGRRRAMQRVGHYLALGMAISNLKRSVPGFTIKDIKLSAAELYTSINKALAWGQLETVQDLMVPSEYKRMTADRERWSKQGWARVEWRLEGELSPKDMKIVQGRLIKFHDSSQVSFVQITLSIPSRQRFAAYSRRSGKGGRPVAGDPDEILDVVDYWVLERKIFDSQNLKTRLDPPGARWRLAARLQVEEGGGSGATAAGGSSSGSSAA